MTVRTAMNEGRVGLRLGRFDGRFNGVEIVAVGDALHVPVIGFEALQHILGEAQLRRPVERDEIVVVEQNQLAQSQRSGQRSGLMRDAFHQIAVAAERISVVIHNLETGLVVDGSQMPLCHGHAHRHADTLAERAGGHFNAFGIAGLGVARRFRMPLAEGLQVVEREVVSGEKKRRVKQRRSVPVRKHKAVPIRPLEVRRIVLHQLVIKQIRDWRVAQRSARVAALCLFNRIHGKQPQGIDG